MKLVLEACVLSLMVSTQLLAEGSMGPARPDWPPPGGGFGNSAGHANPYIAPRVQPRFSEASTYQPRYMPSGNQRYPGYMQQREAPVFPPGVDWPDAAYARPDVVTPLQPGYPVQVIPPPGIPLEGDIMNTTVKPVRNWRPEDQQQR